MNKGKHLVVDWSVVTHRAVHAIHRDTYSPRSKKVVIDYTMQLAEQLLELKAMFEPDPGCMMICLDSYPTWRHSVYDSYYRENSLFFKDIGWNNPGDWYCIADKKMFRIRFNELSQVWDKVQPVKKDRPSPEQLLSDSLFLSFPQGQTQQRILDEHPGAPKDLWLHPNKDITGMLPKYKGKRAKRKWEYSLEKKQYRDIGRAVAYNAAALVDAKVLEVPYAEGDDCMACYCLDQMTVDEITMYTVDSDMNQLLIPCAKNLKIYNPTKHSYLPEMSVDTVRYHLICKLLGGDTSDDIGGVTRPDAAKCFAFVDLKQEKGKTTTAWLDKLIAEVGMDKVYSAIAERTDPESWSRNCQLISLSSIPESIKTEVLRQAELPVSEKKYSWADFNLQPADVLTAQRKELK